MPVLYGTIITIMSTAEFLRRSERDNSYEQHTVEFEDPYLSDDETFRRINEALQDLTDMGYHGDTAIDLSRKRPGRIDRDNPATAELIRRLPSFSDWLDLVPTAAALDSLYAPDKSTLANGKPLSPELAEWFRNITDGRGIRSRAHVVGQLMEQQTLELDRQASWLSLASGAAQPVIGTAGRVRSQGGITPDITLVDRDASALSLARHYAEEAGIQDAVHTKSMNILRPRGIARSTGSLNPADFAPRALKEKLNLERLPAESYDVVEVVGLVEYLKPENWHYTYSGVIKTKTRMAGAETFLKNAYELVRPGGTLMVGNMLDTHPQLGFTLNVIQWPHIQPRSIDQMVEIFDNAGIDGKLDVFVPDDGAYAIYNIRKDEL